LSVVAVALDVDPAMARPFAIGHSPTHPTLVDTAHATDAAFGFVNVPMAVWIDETGTIVRPAEQASIEANPLREMPIPEGLPPEIEGRFVEVKAMTGDPLAYRAAIVDWANRGADSAYALAADEVVARSQDRPEEHARAAACFELGHHLYETVGHDAAQPWWREAHRLFPENWTYKRQAWTLVTTPDGADAPDLMQGPTDVYDGDWLTDIRAQGGGAAYYPPVRL
jgi:hypothetical protein